MRAVAERFITEAEYVELEAASPVKHEYFDGRMYPLHRDAGLRAMAGAKPAHNKIVFNVITAIGGRLREHSCGGMSSDQRVQVEASGFKSYPDALIVCPPERYAASDPNSLLNPRVVFEVLSASTERYDRTDKFDQYKQISSLTDYILIAQDRVRVEHYQRGEGELWTVRSYNQRAQSVLLTLPELELGIPLEEIYIRLDLPAGLLLLPDEGDELADDA